MVLASKTTSSQQFVADAGPRLRRGFVGTLGPDLTPQAIGHAQAEATENWSRVSAHDHPLAYLFGVAVRTVGPPIRLVLPSIEPTALPEVDPRLPNSIASLPERERTAVWLSLGCGWSSSEIATAIDSDPAAVASIIDDAIIRLRRRIDGGEHQIRLYAIHSLAKIEGARSSAVRATVEQVELDPADEIVTVSSLASPRRVMVATAVVIACSAIILGPRTSEPPLVSNQPSGTVNVASMPAAPTTVRASPSSTDLTPPDATDRTLNFGTVDESIKQRIRELGVLKKQDPSETNRMRTLWDPSIASTNSSEADAVADLPHPLDDPLVFVGCGGGLC